MKLGALELGSYAGLTFATCEMILTFRTERAYIWKTPPGSTLVKLLYLLSRYVALAVHVTNTVLATLLTRKYTVIPYHICRHAVLYQGTVLFVMLGILDVILMIRVYALYNRRWYLAIIFSVLLVLRFFFPAAAALRGLPRQRFNRTCLVISAGRQATVYLFAGGELFVQLVILGLTLARHVSATRGGWGNPLFSLLSRDGSMVFFATAVGMIATVAVCLDPVEIAHMVFPALVIIMSSAVSVHVHSRYLALKHFFQGCRLIINMQTMADPVSEPDPILTTMHSVWSGREEDGSMRTRTPSTCVSDISTVHFN
ncbi:hypothetical protein B0H19DRAFT_47004 [Mycena capillaripes]|nr:hypothetical protein B0H19DRAFT_47004 [Mycena capillaripes]